ncbi:hypothetical protein [Deinococcus saxicola]|uniref:hypothetical protein n=1 Tax=Deinococcus saxicola TaxID=249406 RepID=UPI0039EFA9B5
MIKNNSSEDIREHFKAADAQMGKPEPSISNALEYINKIKGFGTPSFASKQLRFLYPQSCPVLDSRMTWLGYEFTATEYGRFAKDCETLAETLTEQGIENPFPGRPKKWLVSDVDMALFARLSGWKK